MLINVDCNERLLSGSIAEQISQYRNELKRKDDLIKDLTTGTFEVREHRRQPKFVEVEQLPEYPRYGQFHKICDHFLIIKIVIKKFFSMQVDLELDS